MGGNANQQNWQQFLAAIRPPQLHERIVTKPYEFSGTTGEDVEEWLQNYNDCALANN